MDRSTRFVFSLRFDQPQDLLRLLHRTARAPILTSLTPPPSHSVSSAVSRTFRRVSQNNMSQTSCAPLDLILSQNSQLDLTDKIEVTDEEPIKGGFGYVYKGTLTRQTVDDETGEEGVEVTVVALKRSQIELARRTETKREKVRRNCSILNRLFLLMNCVAAICKRTICLDEARPS